MGGTCYTAIEDRGGVQELGTASLCRTHDYAFEGSCHGRLLVVLGQMR